MDKLSLSAARATTLRLKAGGVAAFAALLAGTATAQTPRPAPIPRALQDILGCWSGTGDAIGKHVSVALNARAILDGAMVTIDVQSHTIGDEKDRYSAHLVFGGLDRPAPVDRDDVVSFWSDTFGGSYAIMGQGRSNNDSLEVSYNYPTATFVDRWRLEQAQLTWLIIQHGKTGPGKPFATYRMIRAACSTPPLTGERELGPQRRT